MSAQLEPRLTVQEYLALERSSETRREFFRGQVFAMSGASRAHNIIALNIGTRFNLQLKDRDCEAYVSDMRVKVDTTGLYTYPDVVVVCDEPQFEDAEFDTLLNPLLIVEVLSKSTESYDRGKKFEHYRQLKSLTAYVLVSQDHPHIECFSRGTDGIWQLTEATGLDAAIHIPALDCRLTLAEVYAKVQFPPADEDEDEDEKSTR